LNRKKKVAFIVHVDFCGKLFCFIVSYRIRYITNYHVLSGSNPNPKPTNAQAVASADEAITASPPPRRVVDINEPQVCKNKGCGQTFKEKDNHETACSYHPGPAIFHDRMRGVRYSSCLLCISIFKYLVPYPEWNTKMASLFSSGNAVIFT